MRSQNSTCVREKQVGEAVHLGQSYKSIVYVEIRPRDPPGRSYNVKDLDSRPIHNKQPDGP